MGKGATYISAVLKKSPRKRETEKGEGREQEIRGL